MKRNGEQLYYPQSGTEGCEDHGVGSPDHFCSF